MSRTPWITALVLALLPLTARAQTPPPPKEDPEIRIGREAHEDMLKSGLKLISDPALVGRVETIGRKMVEIVNKTVIPATYGSENRTPYPYRFFVVDDSDVNAFALPAGYIYVNKGLLKYVESDDELAGVLGHEIMHAAHHHVLNLQKEQSKLNTQLAIGAIAAILARVPVSDTGNLVTGLQLVALQKVNGYSQQAERDADQGGFELMRIAGYNPVGALTFMERLARDQRNRPEVDLGIFRTHPPEKDRVAALHNRIKALGLPINRRMTTNLLKVTTRPAADAAGVTEVVLDGRVFLRSRSSERVKTVTDTLNRILDRDLQLYDVTRRGAEILARGELVVAVDASEAIGVAGVDAAADLAFKTLRSALYRYALDGHL